MFFFFKIHRVLLELGFLKFEWCNCVYSFSDNVILLLYVDDIVLFDRNDSHIKKAINLLESHFDLKVLGGTKRLLGVEFEEVKNGSHTSVLINQIGYIEEAFESFSHFKPFTSSLFFTKCMIYSNHNLHKHKKKSMK